ncbi:MAG: hypothetical protein JOZ22_26625 [Acidobacteriia bacterium]|nr:hypothetical protein [Terriglobia bacterium]
MLAAKLIASWDVFDPRMAEPGSLRTKILAAVPGLDWAAAGLQDTAQSVEANLPKLTSALGAPDADSLFPTALNNCSLELLDFSSPQPKQFVLEFNPAPGNIPLPELAAGFFEVDAVTLGVAIDLDETPPLSLFIRGSGKLAGTTVTLTAAVPGLPKFPGDLINASLDFGDLTLAPILNKLNVPGAGFENLRLASIGVGCPIPADFVQIDVAIDDVWKIKLGQQNAYFSLDQIGLTALYLTGEEGGFSGMMAAAGHLDDIDFKIQVQYLGGDGGWDLFGKAGNIPVGKVLEKFGFAADSPFTDMVVDSVALHYNTATTDFAFSFTGHTKLSDSLSAAMTAEVKISSGSQGEFEKFFSGKLTVGPVEFDLIFDQHGSSQDFIGLFRNTGDASLSVVDVISSVMAVPSGLGDLNLKIKDALFAYQSETDPGGKKKSHLLFAFDTDLTIDLSGLQHVPLIGQALPPGQNLDLAFEVVACSDGFNANGGFRSLLPNDSPKIPEQLADKFELLTTVRFGDFTKQFDLDIGATDVKSDRTPSESSALPALAPAAKVDHPQKADVQKHFGPLSIESIAVAYDKSARTIAILLSGSLSVTGLDLALDGLGGTYNLTTREITFGLKGLSIDFKRGDLQIGGGFLNVDGDFAGKVVIKTKTFSIAALGAVAITESQPSIFIYGFLNYPLGGPAFFYVEGLAAGFGYNRGFIPPPISDVRSFPLVVDAASLASGQMLSPPKTKDDITKQLTRLHEFIPPSKGEYFFSAGIKFSSFKLLNSFLLVTVVAGQRFEIDILGISTYQNPPVTAPGVPSLAHIELNVLGRIAPDEGFAGIQAQLTDASYIYSGLCKLAGGFAFFTWFPPSPNAGDFVLSVGGYHPAFVKPSHYPDVPRLSLTYQITEDIFVKGSAYFALTPTVLMAGAALEARITLGSLQAWFLASIDFMIRWEPYYYEASLNVSIGARWWIFETELNAQLDIWGPEFSGVAHVNWTVFSFDVSFGGARTGPSPISFERFRDQFLQNDDDRNANKKLLFVRILEGATGSVKQGDAEIPIVNPAQLRLETSSPIPSRTAQVGTQTITPGFPLSDFAIAPMDPSQHPLTEASHTVTIGCDGLAVPNLVLTPLKQSYPPGLWYTDMTVPSDAGVISAIGGVDISAPPAQVLASVSVKRSELDFFVTEVPKLAALAAVAYKAAANFQTATDLGSGFASAASARVEIIRALGLDPVTLVAISPLLPGAFDAIPQVVSV